MVLALLQRVGDTQPFMYLYVVLFLHSVSGLGSLGKHGPFDLIV